MLASNCSNDVVSERWNPVCGVIYCTSRQGVFRKTRKDNRADEHGEKQGLLGDDVNKFADALGLTVSPSKNSTLAQWQTMLTKGPVWAGVALKEGNAIVGCHEGLRSDPKLTVG
jgi:hypothetical protein